MKMAVPWSLSVSKCLLPLQTRTNAHSPSCTQCGISVIRRRCVSTRRDRTSVCVLDYFRTRRWRALGTLTQRYRTSFGRHCSGKKPSEVPGKKVWLRRHSRRVPVARRHTIVAPKVSIPRDWKPPNVVPTFDVQSIPARATIHARPALDAFEKRPRSWRRPVQRMPTATATKITNASVLKE